MNRFKFYIVVFGINLVVFLISLAFKFEYISGVINFLSFIFSILYLLFTLEEPPHLGKLKIPEVHNHYRLGQNDYNNFIALEFGILSFFFFILLYSFQLNFSLVILLLWGISIPVTYYIILLNSKHSDFNRIVDYIHFVEPSLNIKVIEESIRIFIKKDTLVKADLIANESFDTTLLSTLADYYIIYIHNRDNELTPEEIEEINDL